MIVDYFTRWVEPFALPDQKAETVAHPLVHDFVCRFGTPLELHSDQGRNFESDLFQEVCRLFQIAKTRTTPYHPSSNGLVERFNRTLASLIRSYLEEHTTDWDLHIPVLTAAYRATVHPSTGFTPNFMMFGRETTMPVHLPLPRAAADPVDVPEYVQDLQERLARCYELARQKLGQAAESQKRTHDTRITQNHFTPGQAVYKRSHRGGKLDIPWEGPYVVVRILSDCLYLIKDKRRVYAVHHDRLKPCHADTRLPKWVKVAQESCN